MTGDDGRVSVGAMSLPPGVLGLAATFAVCIRLGPRPFATVWAEDGGVFLTDFSAHGWRSVGYLYSGYLHVPSRVLAGFGASALSVSLYPAWCAVASAAVVGVLAAFVFAAARRRIGWWALAPSLSMALAPALRGESLGNLANLQWFLIPAACWALPEQRVSGPAVALAASLASPLAVFALPLLALRRAFRSAVALVAGLVCQAAAMLLAPHSAHPGLGRSIPSVRSLPGDVKLSLTRAVGNPGVRHARDVLVLLAGGFLVLLVARALVRPLEAYAFALCGLGLALAAIPSSGGTSYRYLVAPSVLVVSALSLLEVPRRLARGVAAFGLVLVVISFPVTAYRRSGTRWNGHACNGRPIASVALAPQHWGDATLTCSALH
jgi:hypothetical protein